MRYSPVQADQKKPNWAAPAQSGNTAWRGSLNSDRIPVTKQQSVR